MLVYLLSMFNAKKTISNLKNNDKIHSKLLKRTRILTAISLILVGITIYEIVRYDISVVLSAGIAVVAFLLGTFVFTRMNTLEWDEENQMISTGRMDIIGVLIIFLYIGFEVSLRTIIDGQFAMVAGSSGYLLIGIGASLLGRSVGTWWNISTFATKHNIN